MKNTTEIYNVITKKIITLLENATDLKYMQRWQKVAATAPKNCFSDTVYNGINFLLLLFEAAQEGYDLNRWLTFLQVKQLGGTVKKGAKGTPVIFFKPLYKDKEGNKIEESQYNDLPAEQRKGITKTNLLQYYIIFNVAQVENLPAHLYEIPNFTPYSDFEKDEIAERIILATNAEIFYQGNQACYIPSTDQIMMPPRNRFKAGEHFYSVVFHELAHWTAHATRLNRFTDNDNADDYSREELVAELASAFICASLGFESLLTNNAAYLRHWIKALKEDNKIIIRAASDAQKASNYILNLYEQSQQEIAA